MAKLVQIKCGLPPFVVRFAKEQADQYGLPLAQIYRNMFMEGYYKTSGMKNNSKKERQTNEQL